MSLHAWTISASCLVLSLLAPIDTVWGDQLGKTTTVDYERQIRPLLSDRCYTCHGPDAAERQADLRLDVRREAIASVIVPGSSAESELIARVTNSDPDLRMPPAESNRKPLTESEADLLRQWIDAGAPFSKHWAYVPPNRAGISGASSATPAAIDDFIESKLQASELSPSPPADARTLVRRLSFDLTGLPPAPGVVDAFVANPSEQHYEEIVERLLASPQFGERLAMYWLDLVRYADTCGIHGDQHRDVWAFRDYVINAFNDNMPFDQFTREQLAGDLLEHSTLSTKIASGYNRLLMTTQEGGAQPKEYTAKYAADRVRNVSSVWLGATMGCSECHDHKFDPITQRDFYSFAAFFADVEEIPVGTQTQSQLSTADQESELREIQQQLLPLRKKLATQTPELDAALEAWEQTVASQAIQWQVLPVELVTSDGATRFELLDDGSALATGEAYDKENYTAQLARPTGGVTALRLEALPDDTLPHQGPGRAGNGNFVLSELEIFADDKPLEFSEAITSYAQPDYPVAQIVDGRQDRGWGIYPNLGKTNSAYLQLAKTWEAVGSASLHLKLFFQHGSSHSIGRFRISATTAELADSSIPMKQRAILAIAPSQRSNSEQAALASYYRQAVAPALAGEREAVASLEAREKAIDDARISMLITKAVEPRTMRVLPRGNWLDESGEVVLPAVPAFLGAIPGDSQQRLSRLDLANWLVDPGNPLVARVMVNRLWLLMFGRGLVDSPDDFGAQGATPTHRELLDWLALEFIDSGWDIKHMLRLMANSQTYKRSSQPTAAQIDADPTNALLARQRRFRLEAEMIRDNALTISGLLVSKTGGPSVKPYQPVGYWAHLNFPKRTWQHDLGDAQYRRGLYTYWCRTFLHPSLLAFDATTREECAVQRPQSNTPLQALVLLNDPTYVESARVLAEKILRHDAESFAGQLHYAYREALQRAPRESEIANLRSLFEKHLAEYQQNEAEASNVAKVGLAEVDENLDASRLAAWTSVARVLLNLHETITRY